jgi:phosphatidylcholine synthase
LLTTADAIRTRRIAYLVHGYTASGVVWGLLAMLAVLREDYRQALLWLSLATFVDATDGWLARLADVSRNAPLLDGARLDDVVDFVTYAFVPAVLIWQAGLLLPGWGEAVLALVLVASAWGFARRDAKTADHYFTGFPSYWNVVAVYMLALRLPSGINTAILLGLAILVFVPIRYVYPSRTPTLRIVTVALCAAWSVQILYVIFLLPDPPRWLVLSSFAFPVYYTALSLSLSVRRQS